MIYKWDTKNGLVDAATGKQILFLLAANCSAKFRNMAGRELAEKLNSVERDKDLSRRKEQMDLMQRKANR